MLVGGGEGAVTSLVYYIVLGKRQILERLGIEFFAEGTRLQLSIVVGQR